MCSFGGGLSRFRDETRVPENTCREIVEVPGGPEWKLRRLEEKYEDLCWKYPGCSVIVNYHFNRIKNQQELLLLDPTTTVLHPNENTFYGKVSHFMSPVEISIQPKYLQSARNGIMAELNAYYQYHINTMDMFDKDQIFASVACAVVENDIWYRGKICQVSGEQHIVVELVDIGTQILVDYTSIRPLSRRFGRAPPLCLKCRCDGLSINDLETKDLMDFAKIVESCNELFRVELKSVESEPFLIDLLHPTISDRNVCQQFFAQPTDEGKLDRYDRSWAAHMKKVNEETDDDEDWLDAGDSCSITSIEYIKRLSKCQRAPRFDDDLMIMEHVENSQLIYIQYPYQVEKRAEIERKLAKSFHDLPLVDRMIDQIDMDMDMVDITCCVKLKDRKYRRCIIVNGGDEMEKNMVFLVDYGKYLRIEKEFEFRLMLNEAPLSDEPMITIVSLTRCANFQTPHHSETKILRQILHRGEKVRFRWDKKSKTMPMRGKLINLDGEVISEKMNQILTTRRIDTKCREIDIYREYPIMSRIHRKHHIYRATCHPFMAKGQAEMMRL